jgi:hypothetical protein
MGNVKRWKDANARREVARLYIMKGDSERMSFRVDEPLHWREDSSIVMRPAANLNRTKVS